MDPKIEETDQQTEFKTFFLKIGNLPKNWGNRPKKRKPINKLRIWNFFWKPETDPKNEETAQQTENLKLFWKLEKDPKKEETDQQTQNLKLFLKTGNEPKKWGNGPKNRGNRSTNWV